MSQVVVYYEPGAKKDLYKSDQEALEDFIIVNWGSLEEREENDE